MKSVAKSSGLKHGSSYTKATVVARLLYAAPA